jgi:photosystem II stability/assembly factor-like uncharacterized protein
MFPSRCIRALIGVVLAYGLRAQPSAARVQAQDVAFVDELHGWVSVSQPTPSILRTADGGQTWTRIPLTVKPGFYLLRFMDANTGLGIQAVSAEEVAIYRTVDAGQSWTKVNSVKEQYLSIDDLMFTAPNTVLIVGERPGGAGWVAELSDNGTKLNVRDDLPIDFTQQSNTIGIVNGRGGHLWIVGKELILHSADKGKHWENQAPNAVPPLDLGISGVAMPGGRAWIAVANYEIYRTEDYGKHWTRALTTSGQSEINFDSISFMNFNDGCAVGNSSFIYCTANGGRTWQRASVFRHFPQDSQLRPRSKVFLFKSLHGWASVNGTLYKTDDGGKSFHEAHSSFR